MNIAFQIEAITNSDGDREVVHIECDPTTELVSETLEASEIDEGAWEFSFVLDEDFDGTEPVFARFGRYGLDPASVHAACRDAVGAIASG
jgi:hypothetical protein